MNLKAKIAGILMGLLMSGAALATNCLAPPTIALWATFTDAACDGDTTWTRGATDALLLTAGLSLTETTIGGIDFYALAFDFSSLPGGIFGPNQTASISYTVLINNPLEFWTSFSIDSTCPAAVPGCVVTKTVNGVTLTSTSGVPAGPAGLSGLLLTVSETFTASGTGLLSGATDTYTLRNTV